MIIRVMDIKVRGFVPLAVASMIEVDVDGVRFNIASYGDRLRIHLPDTGRLLIEPSAANAALLGRATP